MSSQLKPKHSDIESLDMLFPKTTMSRDGVIFNNNSISYMLNANQTENKNLIERPYQLTNQVSIREELYFFYQNICAHLNEKLRNS